jgi:hypothetical protein
MENIKQKLIFKLLKEGHINEEEASLLLEKEKEYVYVMGNGFSYTPQSPYPQNPYPYTISTVGNYHISNSRI